MGARSRSSAKAALLIVSVGCALVLTSCNGRGATSSTARHRVERQVVTTSRRTVVPPAFSHIFLVVMENREFASAMSVGGYASLAHEYAYDARSYAASHPSLPNYLALTAGSTFGVTSDCLSCYVSSDNLGAQLSAHQVSWEAFLENVSQQCYLGTSYGEYAAKHNPFRYFQDIRDSRSLCDHLLPYSQFTTTLNGSNVPRFLWVTPNICNDGHSCSAAVAAPWLAQFVRTVTASAAWKNNGLLIVTWDEGSDGDTSTITPTGTVNSTGGGGHVLTLLITPRLSHGTVLETPLTTAGILAMIEQNFGLPLLNGAQAWRGHTLLVRRP